MPDFQPHTLDLAACLQQVQELKALLDSSAEIGREAGGDDNALNASRYLP
jgi:hypothetical protein